MKYARAADGNQKTIVQALRDVGASVATCHTVGQGFPDLVCAYNGTMFMLEVKDPSQPKHRHQLTPAQVTFHENWRGQISIVFTVDDALRAIGALRGVVS